MKNMIDNTLTQVIAECNKRLANPDAYEFEIVDLESGFANLLEKKQRSLHGTPADLQTYFTPAARFLMGRGEAVKYYIGERGILYAMDFEGNETFVFTEPGRKIEAQQMEKLLFAAFPTLSPGLHGLLGPDNDIPVLYGYDYFLCGRDIVLRGTETICRQVLDILSAHGLPVSALPLDKAWLIYEPAVESTQCLD